MNIYNKKNYDEKLSLALTIELGITAIKFCIVQSIPNLYLYNNLANIIISIIMIIVIIPVIKIVVKRSSRMTFSVILILNILIAFNYLVYPLSRQNIPNYILRIYIVSLPCFLIALSIQNYNIFLKDLRKVSYYIIIFGMYMFIMTCLNGAVGVAETEYNMSLSYYLVIPTLTISYFYIKQKLFKDLIFLISGIIIILGMGSRATLICITTFVILLYIKEYKNSIICNFKLVVFVFLSIPLILNYQKIASLIYDLLLKVNINSRTLMFLLNGDISNLTGRTEIKNNILEIIMENPILGIGFLGNISSHNIILEIMLFWGIIVGVVILISLFMIITISLIKKIDSSHKILIIIFISYAIPDSLFNLTVWGQDRFWIMLGLCIATVYKKSQIDI